MKILHITDLHVGKERDLKDLFKGLQHAAGANVAFDFAVISGDLTDRAASREYEELRDFLRTSILRVLKQKDAARIIMVPGNHDVLWNTPSPVAAELPEEEAAHLEKELDRLLERPELGNVRLHASRSEKTCKVLKLTPAHPARFDPCADFFARFYGDDLHKGDHRPFALTSSLPDGHWSAHVFKEEGVAFYGFNSCWANDRHWRGAYIPLAAITAARRHADQFARGLLRVAIWHHGLIGGRGQPDFLLLSEIGELVSAGFDLGIHGHTHRDELSEHFDQLRRRFPIIATGSFSAESHDRPDGVKNQASVLDLTSAYLRWRLYDRDANSGLWSSQPTREVAIRHPEPAPRALSTPKLRSHSRVVNIDNDGIASIAVELQDLELTGDFVLARPSTRADRCVHDQEAIVTRGSTFPISVRTGPDARPEYVLHDRYENTYQTVKWSYRVSNAFALNAEDLELGDYGRPHRHTPSGRPRRNSPRGSCTYRRSECHSTTPPRRDYRCGGASTAAPR